jgi:hypothetical protein
MPQLPFNLPHYPPGNQWQNVALLRNLYHDGERPPMEVQGLASAFDSILRSAHEEMENTCAMIEHDAMQKTRDNCKSHIHTTNARLDSLTMKMRTILAEKIPQYEQKEHERLEFEALARAREASLPVSQRCGYDRSLH